MSNGVVDAFVFGNAEDIKSTNTMITFSKFSHFACFFLAIGCILKYAQLYLGNGNAWSDETVPDRMLMQLVANQNMWLWAGLFCLLAGFVAWLNTDVLINRKLMLQNRIGAQARTETAPGFQIIDNEAKKAA